MCIICDARKGSQWNYKLIFDPFSDPPTASSKDAGFDVPQPGNTTVSLNLPTGEQNIDALLGPRRFAPTQLTFSFPQSSSDYETNYGQSSEGARTALTTFAPVTALMQTAARFVFAQISALTGLSITETTGASNFRLGLFTPAADGTGNTTAFAFLPTTSNVGGDSWYSNTNSFTSPLRGNYAWITMLHEIGHSLGLVHGHETDGVAGVAMTPDRDSTEFSVMTYRSHIDAPLTGYTNERFGYAQTFMMYDIAALQHMYGADYSFNATNTIYTFSPISGEIFVNGVSEGAPGGNRIFSTIWDGGGTDTYDFSSFNEGMEIDLRAGQWSKFSSAQLANLGSGNIARANIFNALTFRGNLNSLIENAVGAEFDDTMRGNQVGNTFDGRGGNDTLNGGSGDDTLIGGAGNDSLIGDFFGVVISMSNPGVGTTGPSAQNIGQGQARTSLSTARDLTANFSLAANVDIQNSTTELHTTVRSVGDGAAHWYAVTISDSNVRLTIDIDDTTIGYDSFVRIATAAPSGGEALFLAGNDDSPLTAGAAGSTVEQDSYLIYTVQNPGTYYVVVGTYDAVDTLAAAAGYMMHISVAALPKSTGGVTDGGTAGNDVLSGGSGNDTLDGGLGADVLDGGSGFDFANYSNSTTGLTLFMGGRTFNTGEANGDIHTSIEGLIGSNFSDIIGGDEGQNELRGLDGNDFIFGRVGIDRLVGGNGNDVLAGGLDGDRLEGGGGIDVASYRDATNGVSASLLSGGVSGEASGDTYLDIENIWGSEFSDTLSGDNNAGQVYGFAGNDNLSGLDGDDFFYGGTGFDTLTGGAGVDNYFFLSWRDQVNAFGTPEPYEGGDVWTDFSSGTDRIILSRYWFGFGNIAGPAAALTSTHAAFSTNGILTAARPSLIWNASNRTLSFDADGIGATQAVLLGTLQAGATLTLSDIWTA